MDIPDAHCHLATPTGCEETDPGWAVVNSVSPKDWTAVARLAVAFPRVVPAFGTHPWHCGPPPPSLEAWLGAFPGAAIGETGLDRKRTGLDLDSMQTRFRDQLALARDLGRVIVIHGVGADGWLSAILRQDGAPAAGFLLHGWTGSEPQLREFARMGGWFSVSPRSLAQGRRGRQTCAAIPGDRLLLESDLPRAGGPIAEPARILTELGRQVADLRGSDPENFAAAVRNNFDQLFGAALQRKDPLPPARTAILRALAHSEPGTSICPSDAARKLAPDAWREAMPHIRAAARQLRAAGLVAICQNGSLVDGDWRGPIRLCLPADPV